ncbi:translocation/assembly module TamB domain-containing protein [Croceicoccus gelatinilyticus]|uniref:translocation/assembly module TamB domain-containing protein n=1 Tax=Croceicoccus gelatinilyticus TaxID=2835536 RepID=UPI001BCFABC5|nr:translocation/assembly module TamB domain-containing protein [Croceicoccus gelatinilyticus]MBS7669177.1 translocation/assembly module TamB domain-containing protein [Croceicoccus gelatinilyticus]
MAEETDMTAPEHTPEREAAPAKPKRDWGKYWRRRIAAGLLGLVLLLGAGALLLDSSIGHRFITNSLASYAPASGLRIKVGRIEGSVLSEATLHDVRFYDLEGEFLSVPEVELDWRPLEWFTSGLDVRKLVARRGTLSRLPELNPGDPDAPLLPDFPIRVDRLELDRLYVDEAVAGIGRYVNLKASADIASGRAKLNLITELGEEDNIFLRLDASEKKNKLDLLAHYNAPAGGFLAGLVGAEEDVDAIIFGDGELTDWDGKLHIRQGGDTFAALGLGKQGDVYTALGQIVPDGFLTGIPARAVGEKLSVRLATKFEASVFDGKAMLVGQGGWAQADGSVDLADNLFDQMAIQARVKDPMLLGMRTEGLRAFLDLDGDFDDLNIGYRVRSTRIAAGDTQVAGLLASGDAKWDGKTLTLPLNARADRIATGVELLDPRLEGASLVGTITYADGRVAADEIVFDAPGVDAKVTLLGNTNAGRYTLAGPVAMQGVELEGMGRANMLADLRTVIGGPQGWSVTADLDGKLTNVSNATLANLAGPAIAVRADVSAAGNAPVLVRSARVSSQNLKLNVSGRRAVDGTVTLTGSGEQASYGAFTVDSTIDGEGPHAVLVFAEPVPAAGLRDVRVAIDPTDDGFEIDTEGQSMLGPFDGVAFVVMPADGPTRIDIDRLTVTDTDVTGSLVLGEGGATGDLAMNGGGVEGTISLAPNAEGQGVNADVILRNARFEGEPAITVRAAHLVANGTIGDATTIEAGVNAQGISRGNLFIGRFAAEGEMRDGVGSFNARLAGRRTQRFNLRVVGDVSPERISVGARGRYAGERIRMPRRAVLTKVDGGWALERTQLSFAGGDILAEGQFGDATAMTVKVADMPLEIADLFVPDLGLGGTVSGVVEFDDAPGRLATGNARLKFDDLTRSGLVLTSRPIDILMAANLSATDLQTRALFKEDGNSSGRLQARIAGLPSSGGLVDRLRAGRLFGQMRYDGPADSLWRLAAIEVFDLTGSIEVAGDVTGTLDNPVVRGTLKAEDMRLQSTLTGTDVTGISARGSFDGSVLRLSRFAGTASNGGSVSGSGSIDMSDIATNGVGMDIRVAAREARLLNRDDMAATVTGPLRIVANNNRGTVAGRLDVISGSWTLNNASAEATLPNVAKREINTPPDREQRAPASAPWRYLIDVNANNRFVVTGMGLDSEWSADVQLRGTTDEPRILGEANLVRGGYEFAGKRFELTRGRIRFSGESPPAPRLDVVAQADIEDINATISITGTALAPQIAFSSIPALPEEEVLSRLLFGDSISNISAPEALQLGAALASLQGDGTGGLDPINKLRSAIGLDRLRVVGADEALGRGTSVAVGEYLGRDLYVELVTDGQGYSATELEYRVTAWLSLLATVSSIGGNGVEAEISKDY